jgi:uncharacterized protein (TIGR00290 family)
MTTTPAWMSWSSGKDSAFALQAARADPSVDVQGLLVTVNAEADRVAMHAVRRTLLEAQAERLELPLHVVEIPSPCPNDVYAARMEAAMTAARSAGIGQIVFGDLFLEDVRAYRERNLAGTGITPVFPLWGRRTDVLARDMLAAGVHAVLTCVDPEVLPSELSGRAFDETLLSDLPEHVDPCGERGEFHTFVWDAPGFSSPIDIEIGETVSRDGFVFRDVLPASRSHRAPSSADRDLASGDPQLPGQDGVQDAAEQVVVDREAVERVVPDQRGQGFGDEVGVGVGREIAPLDG